MKLLCTKQDQLPPEKRENKRKRVGEEVSVCPSLQPHKSLTAINSKCLVWVGGEKELSLTLGTIQKERPRHMDRAGSRRGTGPCQRTFIGLGELG